MGRGGKSSDFNPGDSGGAAGEGEEAGPWADLLLRPPHEAPASPVLKACLTVIKK